MTRPLAALLIVLLALPGSASAWGFEAHKLIADRAIDLLPPELRPVFAARRAFIVERAIDPDLWRSIGWEEEPPNHFLDMDYEGYGKYPFAALPRDLDAAIEKFGREVVRQQGLLPWRVQEIHGKLRREFESLKRQPAPGYAVDNIVYFSAVLAHYVADGHVPLHAVVNYDGQLTGQNGVHGRWESELFDRVRARLNVVPPPPVPVGQPRDFMFDVLLASHQLSGAVLAADRKAAEGREFYDDTYFEAFARDAAPALERRLNESIAAVAGVIIGAWEQAGRPPVAEPAARTPRRVRRPTR